MPHPTSPLVPGIRAASRDLVRVWGFLNRTVAGTELSGSAVHAIIETGRSDGLTARDLCGRLLLEKSTISRLVRSLVEMGEIRETPSQGDARKKHLHLTAQGRKTLAAIDAFAEAQVSGALDQLDSGAQHCVLKGLRDYSAALKAASPLPASPEAALIHEGYTPGLLGRVTQMLCAYMMEHYPFGVAFEARVASDMAEFMPRADTPQNAIWHAHSNGRIAGSITIDGEHLGDNLAHLRWFIVSDETRGTGIGRELLHRALAHCDANGFRETHLWTVKGLDAARSLYERHGFVLAEEYQGDQWGAAVTEQKFIRPLGAATSDQTRH